MFATKHIRLFRVTLKRHYTPQPVQPNDSKDKDSTQWSRTIESFSNKAKDSVLSLKESGSRKMTELAIDEGINKCKQFGTNALQIITQHTTNETNNNKLFERIVGNVLGYNYLSVKVLIVKALLCVLLLSFSFKFCNKGLDVLVEWIFK